MGHMNGSQATAASTPERDALVQQLGAVYEGRTPPPLPDDALAEADAHSGEGVPVEGVGMAPVPAGVALAPPPGVPLFSGLSPQSYGALVERMLAWDAEPGALIVIEGEESDSVFIVVSGRARVERTDGTGAVQELAALEPGAFFGEGALLARRPRAASVRAIERTVLLELPRALLEELATADPQVAVVLSSFARQRLLENLARSSPLFAGLSPAVVRAALAGFDLRRLAASTVVITQGTVGAGLFLVVDGELDVIARGDGGQVHIKRLAGGDVFGEMTLLGGARTSASVVCASACTLLALPRARFSALSDALPELRARLEALAEQRRTHNARFQPDATSSAVLG